MRVVLKSAAGKISSSPRAAMTRVRERMKSLLTQSYNRRKDSRFTGSSFRQAVGNSK
jgi:hypothetical protein